MKTTSFFTVFLLYANFSFAQINSTTPWIWMEGDNTINQKGIYGSQNVSNNNNKPGARNSSSTWTDPTGNLWLFGGFGHSSTSQGYLNDLWKYCPATSEWIWMHGDNTAGKYGVYGTQGIASSTYKPGSSYQSVSWTDKDGNLWLFGGFGYSSASMGLLNALWKYNTATNQWTWVKGDNTVNAAGSYGTKSVANINNFPGARHSSQTWVDAAGNLWLFGGNGYAGSTEGILNDLWKYNIATNEWTWINGDNTINQPAVYGTKAVTSATNKPGARYVSTSWQDATGNVWMFGGYGYDETFAGNLNDMWKYNPSTNQWTWMQGNKTIDQKAVFGTQGVPSITNKPGSRYVSNSWADAAGELWMFGGYGFDQINSGYLNDLWKYNTTNNTWTWIKGDNNVDQRGVYGTQGLANTANKSGARTGAVSWADGIGNLWMFGGYGYDGTRSGVLNDMWKLGNFQPILPLHLLQFSGVLNNTVQLQWQTEQEKDFNHFNIQRSVDGINFTNIGSINGNNCNSKNNYNYADNSLQVLNAQKIFYRLQLMDIDEKFTYSKIISFNLTQNAGSITAFPNPAAESINLSFTQIKKGNTEISITNMAGNTVKKNNQYLSVGKVSLNIDVNTLSPGAYIATVINDSGIKQLKFIKQ